MAQKESDEIEPEIRELAEEITRYLGDRHLVADTIEGITRWWILQQRLSEAKRRVALAMEYLSAKGLVSVRKLPNGELLYSSAPPESDESSR